jgi:hypothetical protein
MLRVIMISMSFARYVFLLALALPLPMAAAQNADSQPLRPKSTAELIKVDSEVTRLERLGSGHSAEERWQILWLHQHISEQVQAASLEVDATIAQIDNEIARANEVRGFLSDRRDRSVSRANLLSALLGGSVGATASGLQLSSNLNKSAAGVGIGAGALSATLALAGIREEKGKTSAFDFDSNMLAEFFGRPSLPNSHYPETVWTFLNEESPNGPLGLSRKQQLLQTWVEVKRIDSLDSTQKIAHLTSEPDEHLQLTIDDFEDRSAMLQDVRARISYLKRDLGALLSQLPVVSAEP